MRESDRLFAGSIPGIYDHYLGPLLFAPYARDLAARLAAFGPARVLETAAGTGIVTRAIVDALPAGTAIVATDLNQPMLDFAAARAAAANLTWRQADALRLPFPDATFDAVACQFGAMFFPDRIAGYREARRVLRPGGWFVFSVWDRIERNAMARIVSDAVATLFPDDPPDFLPRVPYGYHVVPTILAELEAAGFAEVTVDTVVQSSRAPSPQHAAIGFCQGTPLRNEIEARGPSRLDATTEAVAGAVAAHFGDGAGEGELQAHVIVARH